MKRSRAFRRFKERREKALIERFAVDGGLLFNDGRVFSDKDRDAMAWIYAKKLVNNEFDEEMKQDKRRCLDEVAKSYLAQKCAFQDALTKEGFDATQEVLKDYEGRIAALSNHGTLMVFGRPSSRGRYLTMKRIHSPEYNVFNGSRIVIQEDLDIGERASIRVLPNSGFNSSYLRGLAINPHGANGDELEDRIGRTIVRAMEETYNSYIDVSPEEMIESHPGLIII